MKKFKRIFSLCLCSSFMLSTLGCMAPAVNTPAEEDLPALLEKAYIFTLPLMMTDATVRAATNTVKATRTQAPANQFIHAEALATAEFKNVVTPNVDTIYSQLMLDLSEDAVIMELPRTDRFCTAQLLDAYTNCVDVIDASKFEGDRETFIFTGVNFEGEIPEGMTQISYPTSMGWIIIRTICNDQADEANVHAIQNEMKVYTLAQFQAGNTHEPADGTYDEADNFIPSEYVMHLPMQEYFDRANALMADNPPTQADAPIMAELAKINVGPGLTFDTSLFGDSAADLWTSLVSGIVATTQTRSMKFFTQNGNWSYMGSPIAQFGTEYDYRAFIAIFGLGANPVSVAVYPKTDLDSEGGRLNGQNRYVLHFEKDQLPPVEGNGFWSVTAYDSSNNFLIDNEIDRYCINDRSNVVCNEDGSLDIYIQAQQPEAHVENWLPVLEGEFHLVMRIYLPDETVVSNQWPTPVISAVK